MAKRKATRKQLETIVQAIDMRTFQGIKAIDYLVSAYIDFKGDTKEFEEFLKKRIDESEQEQRKPSGKDTIISK